MSKIVFTFLHFPTLGCPRMDPENKDNIVLGEEKFRYFCLEFVKHSQSVGDGWEWKHVQVMCA